MQPVLMGKYQTLAVQPTICRRRPEVPCHPLLERMYSGRYSLGTPGDILWLNKVFDIHRDEKAIDWVRKQADGYEKELKAVSDSLMQERLKLQVESESD